MITSTLLQIKSHLLFCFHFQLVVKLILSVLMIVIIVVVVVLCLLKVTLII